MGRTPEEIKKGLTTCLSRGQEGHCDKCPYYDIVLESCQDVLKTETISLIQQLEAQVPRWISVKENEKPRLRQDCLCICSYSDTKNHEWDYMMVLRWMGEGDNGYVNRPHFQHEGMNGMIVTHWMPLPEPPEA